MMDIDGVEDTAKRMQTETGRFPTLRNLARETTSLEQLHTTTVRAFGLVSGSALFQSVSFLLQLFF
jgi:hypothetical protein